MKREDNSKEDLNEYYKAVIEGTSKLLKDNDSWKNKYNNYLKNPRWKKGLLKCDAVSIWIKVYDAHIAKIEKETDLIFYFSVQGTVSLRYRGSCIIKLDCNSILNSNGEIVNGIWNSSKDCKQYLKTARIDYTNEKLDLASNELLQQLKKAFPHTDAVNSGVKSTEGGVCAGENSYESRILELFDFDRKTHKQMDSFFHNMRPVKRIIRHGKEGEKKREIGFYQLETPIGASKIHNDLSAIHYLKTPKGGIDLLLRRGKGNKEKVLTLVEIKDNYDVKKNEAPELVMGQLVAYATFVCNLLDINDGKSRWGREFGYRNGYNTNELYCIVMMPLPDREGGPRTDFLNGLERIPVKTISNNDYYLNLHYCYFDKNNIAKGIKTSLTPL